MTARDLIARAMRTVGVLAQGETPTAAEQNDALLILQDMLASWATQRLTVYNIERALFDLVASQSTYTIGVWESGGAAPSTHFEHVRPVWIDRAGVKITTTAPYPVELPLQLLTVDDFAEIVIKDTTSSLPRVLYVNEGWPYTSLFVWPVPTVNDLDLVLYVPTAVTGFTTLTADVTFPPGYTDALRYQLAVRLAPEFGRVVDPQIAQLAADALANIKRVNKNLEELGVDPALRFGRAHRTWNWITGDAR